MNGPLPAKGTQDSQQAELQSGTETLAQPVPPESLIFSVKMLQKTQLHPGGWGEGGKQQRFLRVFKKESARNAHIRSWPGGTAY